MNNLRTWFADDIAKVLLAVYFTAKVAGVSGERLRGYVAALCGVAIMIGINPRQVVSDDDLRLVEVSDVRIVQ